MSGSTSQMIGRLVASAREGDRSAFDVLFALSKSKLIVFISRRFMLERDEVEDIVAEAFGKAWDSIAQFRGECAFETWLVTIATNIARNRAGRAYITRELSYDSPIQEGEGELLREFTDEQTPLVDLEIQASEMQDLVQRAIARLRPEYQEVIVLRDFDGLSYKEIAVQLNVTEPALRARLHRARQTLKNLLERDDYFLEYSQSHSRREREAERRHLLDRIEGHRRSIKDLVMRLVGDGSQIGMSPDDLVQEVLIRVWNNLDQYKEQGQLLAWLFAITRNTVINFVRKGKRTVEATVGMVSTEDPDRLYAGDVPDEARAFDDLLAGEEAADELLAELPEEFREACKLSDVGGLQYREVAEALNIPLGTVRSRLFRGRKLLREQLARREEDDLALRPTGRRKKGAGAAKTAQNPAATIHTLRRQVRGWLENATWNNGYKGMDVDILVAETYRRADTWVVAFEGQGRVRFLEEWLKRIAELVAGLAIEELKRQRLQEAAADCEDLTDLDAGLPDGSGQSIDDLLAARSDIAALLTSLPDDLRIAYGLKVVCNSSNKQIADAIGVQAANVRGKLAQARELLTEVLSKEADQLGAAVHATLEAGGEGLSKVKGGGVAIMAGQLARDVEGLPLTPKQGETLYQNWARTVEGGTEQDVARWVAKFGANSPDGIFKRCRCSDPHRPDVLSQMPMIDPSQPASRVAGIGWLNVEVGDLSVYALEEKLSREGDDSHKALLELYYLLGCSNGEEFAARLDYDKIPSSSNEGKGHTEEQGQTLAGEGSAETPMAPPRTNGGRPASELGELIAKMTEKPEPDMTLKEYEMGLQEPDRKKFYEALSFGDFDDFDEWADKKYDPNWKPAYLAAAKGGGSASEAQAATQPDRQEEEAVQTGPFTDLAEFAGKALSEAGMNRLAETPISLWGIDKPGTLAQFLLFAYKKGEAKDGKGLVPLIQLVTSPMFDGKLPMNADSDEFFRMAIAERTRQSKEAKAGDGAGTAASGSQTTTSHAPATGTSGNATPAATSGPGEKDDKNMPGPELNAKEMSKYYETPASQFVAGADGSLIDYLAKLTTDNPGKGRPMVEAFLEEHKGKLPKNMAIGGVMQKIVKHKKGDGDEGAKGTGGTFSWTLTSSEGLDGGSAEVMLDDFLAGKWDDLDTDGRKKQYEQLIAKHPGCVKDYATFGITVRRFKGAGKGTQTGGGDDGKRAAELKAARRALVNSRCGKAVGDYSIASCLPEGWPAPDDADVSVTIYMALLKGAEMGSEEVVAFIADQIGLADHAVEVAELYDELEAIAPEPAPQPAAAPPAAVATAVTATPPAPVAPIAPVTAPDFPFILEFVLPATTASRHNPEIFEQALAQFFLDNPGRIGELLQAMPELAMAVALAHMKNAFPAETAEVEAETA